MKVFKGDTTTLIKQAEGLFPPDKEGGRSIQFVSIVQNQIRINALARMPGDRYGGRQMVEMLCTLKKRDDGNWHKYIPPEGKKSHSWELINPASVEFQILKAMLNEQNNI